MAPKVVSFGVFHRVETFFPLCGKIAKKFSLLWKKLTMYYNNLFFERPGEMWCRGGYGEVRGVAAGLNQLVPSGESQRE